MSEAWVRVHIVNARLPVSAPCSLGLRVPVVSALCLCAHTHTCSFLTEIHWAQSMWLQVRQYDPFANVWRDQIDSTATLAGVSGQDAGGKVAALTEGQQLVALDSKASTFGAPWVANCRLSSGNGCSLCFDRISC